MTVTSAMISLSRRDVVRSITAMGMSGSRSRAMARSAPVGSSKIRDAVEVAGLALCGGPQLP